MTARQRRTLWLAGVVAVLAGPVAAPTLEPRSIFPLSIAWLAIGVTVVGGAAWWLRGRVGLSGPLLLLVLLGGAGWGLGHEWPADLAVRLPCRRNWEWLPSYLLRPSPMRSVSFTLGDAAVKLCYGSPRARGRKMIGGTPVPFGRLWRTGANEPTTLITTAPLEIGGIAIPAGRVSLYTVPGPETWELIVNAATAQWGIEMEYTDAVRSREIGRTVIATATAPVYAEALEFAIEPEATEDQAVLVLRWEATAVRIPLAAQSR
ncbi:MAG: DUF2911 domain-containing protein [Gemmatimonadales bacterium]